MDGSKTAVSAGVAGSCSVMSVQWCGTGVVRPGGYREGSTTQRLHRYCQGPTNARYSGSAPTPRHSRPCGPSAHLGAPRTQICPPGPNRRDSIINILKLVYIPECHLKKVHEAWHTPCFKKPSENHDLEFLRFPIWLSFSPKE